VNAQVQIPEPGPEYRAALEKMLQNARLLRDLAADQIGQVCGALEALRGAANCERLAYGLLMDNVKPEDREPPTTVGIFDEIPNPINQPKEKVTK
jgi:hypothetical protein